MRIVGLKNTSRALKQPLSVRYCERFLCRFLGLMFKTRLDPGEGLLLVDAKASRVNAGIHMLGMFIDLSIIWLDGDLKVVDKALARRWVSLIIPRFPARYVIECAVSRYEEFSIGDQLAFDIA
jgi:uncharacterized membrane protein (UPF0127 family)